MTMIHHLQRVLRRAPERVAWDCGRLRGYLYELPSKRRFESFVESLADGPPPLFMFFTSGLLHVVCKNLEFLPATTPVVLIGADLTAAEQEWIRRVIPRPFHHIERHVDDRVVWEFLFATARTDFGWLDADCFVQDPGLLTALFDFERDTALNCIWSYRARNGHRMSCTHLVAVQREVMRKVRAGVSVSPSVYSFHPMHRSRYRHGWTRRPTRAQVELIETLLPRNADGRPIYPSAIPEKGDLKFFDTLIMYQLCAEALGYRLHAVRDLQGTNTLDRHFSSEVIHVNAASYYRGWKHDRKPGFQEFYRLLLQFDYLLLRSQVSRLPAEYATRLAEMHDALAELGGSPRCTGQDLRAFFVGRGSSPPVFDREEWRFLDG